ncbi:10923_t:CDS:2 [Cetraspora pellucida]|uniref:10923_t:CDS:1 n=1 Tax=Cetraspora pellucida TaxID=1433469 RepID=A0ACA9MF78_9GLOM|nr:10923_t:CDS:2 [Cetraspora pellucida]
MSTLNKESDPDGLNDALAQLDTTQASLESNLEHLSLEALRVVCKGMGVSELGLKKKVVARLAKESRAWLGPEVAIGDPEPPVKEKSVHLQSPKVRTEGFLDELDIFQGVGDGPQQLRTTTNNFHGNFERQPVLGPDLIQNGACFKRASSWTADLDALPRSEQAQVQTQAPMFHVGNVLLAQFAPMHPYVQQMEFSQQVLNQLAVPQGQFGGIMPLPTQSVQAGPHFVQAGGQHQQQSNSNIGMPPPVRQ